MQSRFARIVSQVVAALTFIHASIAQEPLKHGRVTGRVIDARGEGVTAARISAVRSPNPDLILQSTITDADGMFVLSNVAIDDVYPLVVRAESKGRCSARDVVTVSATQPDAWSSLRMWDAGSVDVKVVDEADRPLVGAQVLATASHLQLFGSKPNARGITDASGHVALSGVALGSIVVCGWLDGHATASAMIWLRDKANVTLKLEHGGGVPIHVRVEGLPDECEAALWIGSYETGGPALIPPLVDGVMTTNGVWSIAGLPDLGYIIRPALEGFVFQPARQQLQPRQEACEAVFLARPVGTVRLRGVLRDIKGEPIANASLDCRARNSTRKSTATTDESGRFELDSTLVKGEKAIFVSSCAEWTLHRDESADSNPYSPEHLLGWHEFVVDPAVEIALTAIPALAIEGRVVDGVGKPVRGRRVRLQSSQSPPLPGWMNLSSTISDVNGSFAFRGVHPLAESMRVSVGDLASGASAPFVAKSGQEVGDIVLKALPFGVVEGLVRDEHGQALPGARVGLSNLDSATGRQSDGNLMEVLSDRDGRYRMVEVEPGEHGVILQTDDMQKLVASSAFEVEPGAVVVQNLDMRR